MFPGYGMADIEAVCRALGEINFEGVLSMEPSHRNMPKERLLRVLEHIIPVVRYYGDIVDANRPQGC
jgi:sugar phosphate isomerase/epimerase